MIAKEDEKNPIYDNNQKKRALHLEDDNSSEQPFKKKSVDSAALHFKNNDTYKHRKKKKDEEKHWKDHGHLPKTSTKKKSFANSQVWKSSFLTTDLRIDLGGYTARSSKLLKLPDIQSLDEAIAFGFVILKSTN
jgi:Cu/Zn superoxide dismutase